MTRIPLFATLFASHALLVLCTLPAAAAPPDTPKQAAWALHLLEAGRFGEAIPAAQSLVDSSPADPLAYQVRAAAQFYVGSLRGAQADSVEAATLAPRLPAARYALALCDLFGARPEAANTELTQMADALPLSDAQKADVATARAFCLTVQGENLHAAALLPDGGTPDALRTELSAMLAVRMQSPQAVSLLTNFLATPSGCPRVTEDAGLRVVFGVPGRMLEASVTEKPLQAMWAASLQSGLRESQKTQKSAPHLSGTVDLNGAWTAGRGAMVSFSVDGGVVGMSNAAPYRLEWRTETVPNGWHSVRTDVLDGAGQVMASRTQTVRVDNAGVNVPAAAPSDPALQARLWNLLRLRPSRKSAEWTLAALLDARGEHDNAAAHRAVCAALDPDFHNARASARAAFRAACALPTPARMASARPSGMGLWSGPANAKKQVALTFDDGPNPLKTPALLDALDAAHCPATFFVVGARAEAAPELVRRMAARGDDVENHSYTHPNMAQVAPVVAEEELLRTSVVIRSLSGRLPRFFRPPGGNSSPALLTLARTYGLTGAFWTEDALRFEDAGSPQALVDYVLGHLQPGSIVLLHNGSDTTVAALPKLVQALRARGYHLVTLSQMTHTAVGVASVHVHMKE